MAQFVEACPSCRLAVYLEDNVPGACSCPEGALRQLLARARGPKKTAHTSRVANQATPIPRGAPRMGPLPDLSPEMFLSRSALQEVRAARTLPARTVRVPEDFSFEDPGPGAHDDLVDAIWQTSRLAGNQDNDFQVEFGGDDIDLDVAPTRGPLGDPRGARFRVDRPPPEPARFQRDIIGGPMRDVGQARGHRIISDRGGIPARELPAIREAPSQGQVVRTVGRPYEPRIPAREANARSETQRMADHMRRPTAYDAIRGPDPFDSGDDF